MARELHDFYFRKAKEEGYLSRAAYKLIEIDDRRKIIRRGDLVLDCGYAPGSWVQVALRRVGSSGAVVGIDLKHPTQSFTDPNVRLIEDDFTTAESASLLHRLPRQRFDVILSDMAPDTTGDPFSDHHRSVRLCHALLDRCATLLRPGGNLVMKVFEGEAYPELLKRTTSLFDRAKGFKPKASRDESVEMYLLGHGLRPVNSTSTSPTHQNQPVSRPRPSSGWGS